MHHNNGYKFMAVLLGMALIFVGGIVSAHADEAISPQIALDYIPAYNAGYFIEGHVWFDGAAGEYRDLAVTAYVQVENGGNFYGPKPYADDPVVRVNEDGRFEDLLFVTGGVDELATQIRVYLIPSSFTPDSDMARTKKAAYCWVTIDRSTDGKVTVQYSGQSPENEISAKPVSKPVREPIKHSANTAKLSLAFSPYVNGLSPNTNDPLSLDEMKSMLTQLDDYADTIRLFGVTGELNKIIAPAKQEFGLRIIAGAWIDSQMTQEQITSELDTLIALANEGMIDMAVVGSETLYRGDFSVDELVGFIDYVRSRVGNPELPVTTSDTAGMWLSNGDALIDSCDAVLYTTYPYFSRVSAEDAASFISHQYSMMKLMAGGKPVIISEVGHPTDGSVRGASVPGMDQAKQVFESIYWWARENDVEVVWFGYIDEEYKLQSLDVEGHWGLFTGDKEMKIAFRDLLNHIAVLP